MDHPAMANACKLWRAIIRNAAFVVARRGAEHAEPFVVAVAGEDAQGITHNRVSLLSGDKWLQLAPLPHPTGHHCAVVCGGEIYVTVGHLTRGRGLALYTRGSLGVETMSMRC